MKVFISIALICIVTLTGCKATRYVDRGDEDLLAGRPSMALANYKRALAKDPNLREKPAFQAKLLEANWRSSFEEAKSYERQLGWEQAISKYEETLRYHPGFQPAIDGIAAAKTRGANQRYETALNNANNGDLGKAAVNLRRSLELNRNNASALSALASIEGGAPPATAAAYSQAQSLTNARQWQHAATAYEAIIRSDRNHLPSRIELFKAKQKLDASTSLSTTAAKQLGERRLDASIASAKESLAIWPSNNPAQESLSRALSQREQAEALYQQALQQKGNQQWDAAIISAQKVRAAFPFHPAMGGFDQQVKDEAAQTYVTEGNRLLEAGELEAANNTFRAAFKYKPSDNAAKKGLAEVAHAHGKGAETDGLPGNALLWYMDSQRQQPKDNKYQEAVSRARAKVAVTANFDITLTTQDSKNNTNADTAKLQEVLTRELIATKPAYVNVTAGGANQRVRGPLYKAMVTLNRIQTEQRLISTQRKVHVFTNYKSVPNPKIPYLDREFHSAERELARARVAQIRNRCNSCSGRGDINCSRCGGRGKHRHGDKESACSVCGGRGHSSCGRCGGRGHYFAIDSYRVNRAAARVNDLARQLRHEPRFVKEKYQLQWPYTVETHARRGEASAVLNVIDANANNKTINSLTVNPVFNITDQMIVNPNPKLGLQEDRLVLPTDAFAYNALMDGAAKKAVPAILEAAAVERANSFINEANKHAREGRADLDLEARMTAMVILEPVRPKDAQKILTAIHNP